VDTITALSVNDDLWIFWSRRFALHAFTAIVSPSICVLPKLDDVDMIVPWFFKLVGHRVCVAILALLIAVLVRAGCEFDFLEAAALAFGAAVIDAANLASFIELFIVLAMEVV